MTINDRPIATAAPPTRGWAIYFACCGLSIVALLLAAVIGINRDSAQDEATKELLSCFDDYAASSAATSRAVRDASVELADVTTARDVALDRVFRFIATEPARDDPRGVRLFGKLLDSNAALVEAQAVLADVRVANPVPDPPSTFCEVQP